MFQLHLVPRVNGLEGTVGCLEVAMPSENGSWRRFRAFKVYLSVRTGELYGKEQTASSETVYGYSVNDALSDKASPASGFSPLRDVLNPLWEQLGYDLLTSVLFTEVAMGKIGLFWESMDDRINGLRPYEPSDAFLRERERFILESWRLLAVEPILFERHKP